jgi:hypothetical protein
MIKKNYELTLAGRIARFSFDDNPVRPLYERDKDRWISEFCSPLIQVCFRDPTGPGAGASGKYWNMFRDNFLERFAQGWPANRQDGAHHGLPH